MLDIARNPKGIAELALEHIEPIVKGATMMGCPTIAEAVAYAWEEVCRGAITILALRSAANPGAVEFRN